jgi:predicted nuclease of predicted toxin-antitoxin system
MGSLSSELRVLRHDLAIPRVYADANLPWGVVSFMRHDLKWDVLFVLEEPELRRAPDREHFARALDLGRTLITQDHDFADERRFPPACSPGVVICTAPDEAVLKRLLTKLDEDLRADPSIDLPLKGKTIELTPGG